ncbi:glycosyltransferase family 9 protein [Runella salmonicolor]|uniref:Glycosyltransferase family 9 protein n=1 Tax=Runella salmonicolor TaxID=2950278 RepID=A0ABT1FRG8_9BACT|nr:glycosyltransferase family 9 protein [Runella salmonicolor]MCP1384366.1 glycosyltransferase family 9 protein [Runella salmonicolor]
MFSYHINLTSRIYNILGKSKRNFFNTINFCTDSVIVYLFKFISKKKKPINLCIVRLDVIGDFFLWSYYIESILEHYKENAYSKTILIAENSWANYAKHHYTFNEVISIKRAKFRMNPIYRVKVLIKLLKFEAQVILKPSYTREVSLEESIVRCMTSKTKIGYLPVNQGNEWRFWEKISESWFTTCIEGDTKIISEIEKNSYFLEQLQIKKKEIKLGYLDSKHPSFIIQSKYFIIFPGASVGRKKWGVQNFASLINRILEVTDLCCIICGSSSDIEISNSITNLVRTPNRIYNEAGKTSLSKLLTVIENAEILIGNDTSGIHIAAAVGTKSICILGGGHFGRFLPYPSYLEPKEFQPVVVYENMACFGCDWKCKYTLSYNEPVPCITNVSVDAVFSKFKDCYSLSI